MTLGIAVAAALGAAAAFGLASAVQFRAASRHAEGAVDAGLLAHLLHDPLWLSGILADVTGLGLQVLALANGPVSLVQPIQVLGLLVALPVATALGAPRPHRHSVVWAAVLIVALGGFLALLGDPGQGRVPHAGESSLLTASFLAVGTLVCLASRQASPTARATVFGLVSGAWFSLTAVLLREVSLAYSYGRHLHAFSHPRGLAPLIALAVAGVAAIALSQAAYQVGPLTASLPAQSAADPVASVILGTVVLGEQLPLGGARILAYAVTLGALIVATRALATPAAAAREAVEHHQDVAPTQAVGTEAP